MSAELKSERIVVSAPLSFNGSALRIWKVTKSDNQTMKWLVLVPIAIILVFCAWIFVAIWYFVMNILFGILFIPYRLIRRSGRKQKRDNLRHRELLDAIERQKSNEGVEIS